MHKITFHTLLALLAGTGILFMSACSGENSPPAVPPTASTQEPPKDPETELPPKIPDQEVPPSETRLPDLSLVLPDDPIPDWINDKPDIKFDSLSAVTVKVISAPQADNFGNFGPGVPNLDPYYLRTEGVGYQIAPGGLKEKAMPYTDRKYEIQELPAPLKGATLLQTRNGHKGVTHPDFSIVLNIETPAYLFVAVDERMIRIWGLEGAPEWVREFSPTGYRIVTDDPTMHALRPYQVVTKKVEAGEIKLGPPWTQSQRVPAHSMYFVFVGSGKPKP